MIKKAIIINGSIRIRGNTDTIVASLIKGTNNTNIVATQWKNTGMITGKKAIIITPMHVNKAEHGAKIFNSEIEPIKMTYHYILKRLGIEVIDMIFYPGLSNRGDAEKNNEYLNSAYKIGAQLCDLK
jgi:predicted phosphohydrolase